MKTRKFLFLVMAAFACLIVSCKELEKHDYEKVLANVQVSSTATLNFEVSDGNAQTLQLTANENGSAWTVSSDGWIKVVKTSNGKDLPPTGKGNATLKISVETNDEKFDEERKGTICIKTEGSESASIVVAAEIPVVQKHLSSGSTLGWSVSPSTVNWAATDSALVIKPVTYTAPANTVDTVTATISGGDKDHFKIYDKKPFYTMLGDPTNPINVQVLDKNRIEKDKDGKPKESKPKVSYLVIKNKDGKVVAVSKLLQAAP